MQKLVLALSMGIFIALAVFVSANIVLADDGKQSDSQEMLSKQISREDIGRKMRVAVANGDITAEEAREKWAAMESKKVKGKQISREDIGRKMRVAVANGDITAEEAREKWAAMESKKGKAISTR